MILQTVEIEEIDVIEGIDVILLALKTILQAVLALLLALKMILQAALALLLLVQMILQTVEIEEIDVIEEIGAMLLALKIIIVKEEYVQLFVEV